MAHTKGKLRKLTEAKMMALIMELLAAIAITNPKLYKSIEKRYGLTSSSQLERPKRRMTKAQRAGLRKAIRANPRMSAAAKRKALRRLGA